jgi:cytochrome c peroxidase
MRVDFMEEYVTNKNKATRTILLGSLFGVSMVLSGSVMSATPDRYMTPAEVPAPASNKLNDVRVELGKQLFFDPRLSGSNWISCATCHNPALGWSDGLKTAIGNGQKVLGRNTPTIINTAFNDHQFWDGRAKTLEEQALGPIQAAGEMNQNLDELVSELKAIPGYVESFKKAYPDEGITKKSIGKAIASFERTIVSRKSPFDRWVAGDKKALTKAQLRGFAVFEGKGKCATCHTGFNFTDNNFYNIGIKSSDDPGRFNISKEKSMLGAMKTPTLRDVSLSAPYMHNGEFNTLEEVVEHYNRGGVKKEGLSEMIIELGLSQKEKSDLVAFLESLTGEPQNVTIPRLPK